MGLNTGMDWNGPFLPSPATPPHRGFQESVLNDWEGSGQPAQCDQRLRWSHEPYVGSLLLC